MSHRCVDIRPYFFIVLFAQLQLSLCKYPAICFVQTVNSFKIIEPISYSESGALKLPQPQPTVHIRCACPKFDDGDKTLSILPRVESVADPQICSRRVRATLRYLSATPGKVHTYRIGFRIWENGIKKFHFVPVVELNFDSLYRTPIYALYRFRSPNLTYMAFWASQRYYTNQEYETNAYIFGDQNLDDLYASESQRKIFSPFFSNNAYDNIFNSSGDILVKQQLAQSNDFLLETWKEVTYFNVNTAPMFQRVHRTWMKIETFVVNVAKALQRDLYIRTGTSMVKELHDSNGGAHQIYLNNQSSTPTIPVPEIFWKALEYQNLHDKEDHVFGLLVIMHNDPLYKTQEPICPKVSAGEQWDEIFEDDVDDRNSKKIAYTCELNEENVRRLRLRMPMSFVDNFLDVQLVQERFDTDNPNDEPVYRFV